MVLSLEEVLQGSRAAHKHAACACQVGKPAAVSYFSLIGMEQQAICLVPHRWRPA